VAVVVVVVAVAGGETGSDGAGVFSGLQPETARLNMKRKIRI